METISFRIFWIRKFFFFQKKKKNLSWIIKSFFLLLCLLFFKVSLLYLRNFLHFFPFSTRQFLKHSLPLSKSFTFSSLKKINSINLSGKFLGKMFCFKEFFILVFMLTLHISSALFQDHLWAGQNISTWTLNWNENLWNNFQHFIPDIIHRDCFCCVSLNEGVFPTPFGYVLVLKQTLKVIKNFANSLEIHFKLSLNGKNWWCFVFSCILFIKFYNMKRRMTNQHKM